MTRKKETVSKTSWQVWQEDNQSVGVDMSVSQAAVVDELQHTTPE